MINIIKHLEDNCKDKSVEGIIKFLYKYGDIASTSEAYREVYYYYWDQRDLGKTDREARRNTIDKFNLSDSKYIRILKKYSDDNKLKLKR